MTKGKPSQIANLKTKKVKKVTVTDESPVEQYVHPNNKRKNNPPVGMVDPNNDPDQPLLDALDVEIERNSFGRQKDSFEAEISLEPMDIPSFQGVFIRAPAVLQTGSGVETLGKFNEKIIAVKQGNILATSFHPELTRDVSLHKQFVQMVAKSKN